MVVFLHVPYGFLFAHSSWAKHPVASSLYIVGFRNFLSVPQTCVTRPPRRDFADYAMFRYAPRHFATVSSSCSTSLASFFAGHVISQSTLDKIVEKED